MVFEIAHDDHWINTIVSPPPPTTHILIYLILIGTFTDFNASSSFAGIIFLFSLSSHASYRVLRTKITKQSFRIRHRSFLIRRV